MLVNIMVISVIILKILPRKEADFFQLLEFRLIVSTQQYCISSDFAVGESEHEKRGIRNPILDAKITMKHACLDVLDGGGFVDLLNALQERIANRINKK